MTFLIRYTRKGVPEKEESHMGNINKRIDDFHKKLIKEAINHRRLSEELPEDKHYHDGKSDMAAALKVQFKLLFEKEIKQHGRNMPN